MKNIRLACLGLLLFLPLLRAETPATELPVLAELSKEESLELVNLQYTIQAAEADLKELYVKREAMIDAFLSHYKLDPKDRSEYMLDVKRGQIRKSDKPKVQAKTEEKKSDAKSN